MKITSKQKEVVDCIKYDNPKILICSGAKRAGKTFILIYAFIAHIAKYENKGYSFILGGTNQASIRRNILNDLEEILDFYSNDIFESKKQDTRRRNRNN